MVLWDHDLLFLCPSVLELYFWQVCGWQWQRPRYGIYFKIWFLIVILLQVWISLQGFLFDLLSVQYILQHVVGWTEGKFTDLKKANNEMHTGDILHIDHRWQLATWYTRIDSHILPQSVACDICDQERRNHIVNENKVTKYSNELQM